MKDWRQRIERGLDGIRERAQAARAAADARGSGGRADPSLVASRAEPPERLTEPPVVARLVVEIRSDGSRTVARGALEDVVTGERSTIEATGGSPVQLAASLVGSLVTTPLSLGRSVGALVKQRLARGLDGRGPGDRRGEGK